MIAGQAELAKIVNRLYWNSSESVNQIADSLDLSKGALYGLIEPAATEGTCADCGSRLSFANRTARDRGLAECLDCSLQPGSVGEEVPPPAPRPDSTLAPVPPPRRKWGGRALAGSLLLGVVAGLLIVRFVRRR